VGRRLSELLREPGLKWRAGVAGMGGDGHAAAAEFNTSAVELIVLCTGRTLQTVAAATDAAAPPFSKVRVLCEILSLPLSRPHISFNPRDILTPSTESRSPFVVVRACHGLCSSARRT